MARAAGAKKVYFASASPPVRFPNVYGIDMPNRRELVATGRTEAEIAREIGELTYLPGVGPDLRDAAIAAGIRRRDEPGLTPDRLGVTGDARPRRLAAVLAAVGAVARRHGKVYVVDAMSSFGAIPLDFEACGIDYLISSANKCLEGVPGFSFVLARRARLLALTLHGNLETGLVDADAALSADVRRQIKRKAVGVIEPKRRVAIKQPRA